MLDYITTGTRDAGNYSRHDTACSGTPSGGLQTVCLFNLCLLNQSVVAGSAVKLANCERAIRDAHA